MTRIVRRTLPIVAALMALAISAAACSKSGPLSHADYQKKLTQIGADLRKQNQAFSKLNNVHSISDLKQLVAPMKAGAAAVDAVANELKGLTPPADAAAANQALVTNLPKVADDFREFADAIDKSDLAKLTRIGKEFQSQTAPGLKEVTDAISQLKSAGYQINNG